MKNHFEKGKKNATYQSDKIQKVVISLFDTIIKESIVDNVKEAYILLADETADISGKVQSFIGLLYFDKESHEVKEEFIGLLEHKALDEKHIAKAIDDFFMTEELDPEKCVDLGVDGCSTMSGKEGVQEKSSHKPNLVVNDLNTIPDIRNTAGTIKDIITFYSELVLRRKLMPNIPSLCQTKWPEQHKSTLYE